MATKRPAPHVHPSRQDQVPEESRRKRQKPNNAGPKSFKKAHPVNDLKSQIRSLKRLLERNEKLPANVRVEKERELQSVQYELEEKQRAKTRSEMIGRYHKIRFFDRKKATKRLKRARKELNACEGDDEAVNELQRKVDKAEVDVNYATYFPLDQPYVPLFPRKKTVDDAEGEDDAVESTNGDVEAKGDPEMRQTVGQCMRAGTLDALRNGKRKVENTGGQNATQTRVEDVRQQDRSSAKLNGGWKDGEARDEDEESDGGFFE